MAEVDSLNTQLVSDYSDIDGLLAWTLEIDDYVDLETLKVIPAHPEFDPGSLGRPVPPVAEMILHTKPSFVDPPAPKGLAAALGRKRKHVEAVVKAEADHEAAMEKWQANVAMRSAEHADRLAQREKDEAARHAKLDEAKIVYQAECVRREAEAATKNSELTKFVNDLAFDVQYAIEDYVGIVLSNSVYPDVFPVEYQHSFDLTSRELTLSVSIPEPMALPSVKEYRYVKAKDEIAHSQLPAKAQKDRYTSAVHQVAVRTLHEIFEADRAGKIHSIALSVGVNRTAPATGRPETVPLVQVGAGRVAFGEFDLANVVPQATLTHLGAAMSKSPFDLTPAIAGRGVRKQGQS